jgi:hypothetical protein
MVDLIETSRADIAETAVGDRAADAVTVRSKLNATLERIRGDQFVPEAQSFSANSYDAALTAAYQLFRTEAEALAEAKKNLNLRESEAAELRQAVARQKEAFDEQAAQVQKQLADLQAERDKSRQTEEQQVDAFEKQLTDIKTQSSEDIQALRTENARLREELTRSTARFTDITEKLGSAQVRPGELVTARVPDGHIVKATPGDDVVYIDLGARDHLTLGLEFAVYEAGQGIPEDGRAKARIEVISINQQTAECRITEMLRPELILANDVIANPIYDRTRTLRFYTLGTFDLNGDGRDDPDGQERMRALVKAWGGQVSDQLTAQVDFVLLGGPPSRPARKPEEGEELTPQEQRAQKAYDDYSAQVDSIRVLSIPAMTQQVFLNFLGYGGRSRPVIGSIDITAQTPARTTAP